MRKRLAEIFVEQAKADPNVVVLSGDHGYALFDPIRKQCPSQFINVGVSEPSLVVYAAGLAHMGLMPIIYGLASFVPMRVLEQIRLDICFANYKVIILGDGAGLVYSSLGSSHQCTEDIAVTRVLPNLKVFSPSDQFELEDCISQAFKVDGPSYIRLGKADRPTIHKKTVGNTKPRWTHQSPKAKTLLVSTGSLNHPAMLIAKEQNHSSLSIPQLNPLHPDLVKYFADYKQIICLEEHNRNGGLYSSCLEFLSQHNQLSFKKVHSIAIDNKFNTHCGSYSYALSEHGLTDEALMSRVFELTKNESLK